MNSLRKRISDWLWRCSKRLALPGPAHAGDITPEQKIALSAWRASNGDLTHRLDYVLTPSDLVVDVGGYEGQWASDIHARFRCPVHIFEPAPQFAAAISKRFAHNPALTVHVCGLGSRNGQVNLSLAADASSTQRGDAGQRVEIRAAADTFCALGFKEIALLKINIEGDEFDLLPHLIASGWIRAIRDVQIQFHSFVPDAETRRAEICQKLAATHDVTYDYPFVWENWRRRAPMR